MELNCEELLESLIESNHLIQNLFSSDLNPFKAFEIRIESVQKRVEFFYMFTLEFMHSSQMHFLIIQ